MTSAHIDRRIGKLETRVTDIEESHSETLYQLTRAGACCRIETGRLIDGVNQLGRGMALIMERLEIPPIQFPPVSRATEAEIDAALEA
ncbi:hypothetical protein [Nocardia iowensis]|uniref:Transcriptional regulator n=1 Tax=Nocardia iowensis TaxID=204891 RepID=A0ABX8RST9_NOCIO|nr:hypothetical protein [Nocardia iowensis]QXN92703.1 hypothetical protein KV110_06105 [Nocardia iowensis]